MMVKSLSQVTLNVEAIHEYIIGGQKSLSMVVSTDSFLGTNIPNKANSRNYTGKDNKAVPAMISTLRTEPEMFRFKNLGIRMVASDYIREDNGRITLLFDEDEGIFNGGHTYTVLKTYGNSAAYVNVTVDLQLPKDKLVEISLALNMSKKLEDISVGEKTDKFEWVKKALPYESIEYKEGDEGVYNVKDVLKVANIFKVGADRRYSASFNASIRRAGAIVKENNEKQSYNSTEYILPDMWELYKQLITNEVIVRNLPDKMSKKGNLVPGMAIVLLSGVRYMTFVNKNGIPRWKEGYNVTKALAVCEKVSKKIGRELNKAQFKDLTTEHVIRNVNAHNIIQLIFSEEING